MTWFLVALIAPALWSVSNHIDKFLVDKKFKGVGIESLMLFSSLIGFLLLPIIYLFYPEVIFVEFSYAMLMIVSGVLAVVGFLPYFLALQKDETSIVAPLYQMVPVFSYFLGLFFLGEKLTFFQILGSILIIFGAVFLSFDFSEKKIRFKHNIFWLMFISSFIVSLNFFIFKLVAIREDFWVTSFWEYTGYSIAGLFMLCIKSYRQQFFGVFKNNAMFMININAFNELINIIGKIVMNIATLMTPLALALVVNGFQPVFVLIFGFVFTKFYPNLVDENIEKGHFFRKFFAVLLMLLGLCMLGA